MRELVFELENVEKYYHEGFSQHFQKYFEISAPNRHGDIAMILHPSVVKGIRGNPARGALLLSLLRDLQPDDMSHHCCISSTESNFIFAGIVMHMITIPQAINAVCGNDDLWDWDLVKDFHLASGWPQFSAGLGGPYACVERMLMESGLYPQSFEVANFVRMLAVVAPFMRREAGDFLSGKTRQNLDAVAYDRLLRHTAARNDEIVGWLESKVSVFIANVRKPGLSYDPFNYSLTSELLDRWSDK